MALVAALCSGCEGSLPLPPNRYASETVAGRITLAGAPVDAGWVMFQPTDSTIGRHTIGRIRSGGRFVAEMVPLGRCQVRIELPPGRATSLGLSNSPIRRRLALLASNASPLRWQLEAGSTIPLEFDLANTPLPQAP